jgi:glutamate/tyrosine decarboxylase-like PLP-dependent enzyme
MTEQAIVRTTGTAEETLDPQDWEELRSLGHRMLDDMFDYLRDVRDRPAWQPPTAAARAVIAGPLPRDPSPAGSVYDDFREAILPFPTGNIHPRFWGWVMGTGTPFAMLADMLASGMNAHVAGYDQAASNVERQTLDWLKELMGFPQSAGGLLVGGGTMANLLGVATARQALAGFDVRVDGLQGDHPALILYASTETHSWVQKAAELLGIGTANLRRIAVDADFRIDTGALRAAIAADRTAGRRPFCVVGSAGTVNTGATDDLVGLREICDDEGLWFHVDGAFGALAALSPAHRDLVAGLDRADSLAFDLHKWMYLPFEAGCVLVRDPATQRAAFALTPSYLRPVGRGPAARPMEFADIGLDLSRGFRALRVWMSLRHHGSDAFGRLIGQNIEQARYLAQLVRAEPELELLAPVAMNVVCFRYVPPDPGFDRMDLDALNTEVLLRVQESGVAVPSSTSIGGRFAIRVAITNHRSRREDFALLVSEVLAHGRAIAEVVT